MSVHKIKVFIENRYKRCEKGMAATRPLDTAIKIYYTEVIINAVPPYQRVFWL